MRLPTHECPVQGCSRQVPHEELACPSHWVKLPWRMRTNLSQAFRRRDYVAHCEALEAALDFYRTHDVDALGESRGGHTTTTVSAGSLDSDEAR